MTDNGQKSTTRGISFEKGINIPLREVWHVSDEDRRQNEEYKADMWAVILPWMARRMGITTEDVRKALNNNAQFKYWSFSGLRQAYQDRDCYKAEGYADGTQCDGKLCDCPHSQAYYDFSWERDEATGEIHDIEVKARICPLAKRVITAKKDNAAMVF